jgi:hypothetical protein
MKVAVDVGVGRRGIRMLQRAGHEVVVKAEPGETDGSWFFRAMNAGAEIIISPDRDLNILGYDHKVRVFKQRRGHSGVLTVQRLLERLAREAG